MVVRSQEGVFLGVFFGRFFRRFQKLAFLILAFFFDGSENWRFNLGVFLVFFRNCLIFWRFFGRFVWAFFWVKFENWRFFYGVFFPFILYTLDRLPFGEKK